MFKVKKYEIHGELRKHCCWTLAQKSKYNILHFNANGDNFFVLRINTIQAIPYFLKALWYNKFNLSKVHDDLHT